MLNFSNEYLWQLDSDSLLKIGTPYNVHQKDKILHSPWKFHVVAPRS